MHIYSWKKIYVAFYNSNKVRSEDPRKLVIFELYMNGKMEVTLFEEVR